jgi:hypothetical protein
MSFSEWIILVRIYYLLLRCTVCSILFYCCSVTTFLYISGVTTNVVTRKETVEPPKVNLSLCIRWHVGSISMVNEIVVEWTTASCSYISLRSLQLSPDKIVHIMCYYCSTLCPYCHVACSCMLVRKSWKNCQHYMWKKTLCPHSHWCVCERHVYCYIYPSVVMHKAGTVDFMSIFQ